MISKYEDRFKRLREEGVEEKYLRTVELISNYINSANTLEQIERDLSDSSFFTKLDNFDGRLLGSVAYVKLVIDEFCDLVRTSSENNASIIILLQDISELLNQAYKAPPSTDVNALIEKLNKLFDLDDKFFKNNDAKTLFFSVSYLLQLIKPTLNSLYYWERIAVFALVSSQKLSGETANMLKKIEEKMERLAIAEPISVELPVEEVQVYLEMEEQLAPLDSLQAYFNKRHLAIFAEVNDELLEVYGGLKSIKKLTVLEEQMEKDATDLGRYLTLKQTISERQGKINALMRLLENATANDSYIYGRQSFLEFITRNSDDYEILKKQLNDQQGKRFMFAVNELSDAVSNKDYSQRFTNAMSWITAPMTVVIRATASQTIQDDIREFMPDTKDSECKRTLKILTERHLQQLLATQAKEEQEFAEINNRLFNTRDKMCQLAAQEDEQTLITLQRNINTAKESITSYKNLLVLVKENMGFVAKFEDYTANLADFIRIHDDFWVRLSNFFAQICSIFKSEAAKMIDEAKKSQERAMQFSKEYQDTIKEQLHRINSDLAVDETIKTQLQEHFHQEVNVITGQRSSLVWGKKEVLLVIKELEQMFSLRREVAPNPDNSANPEEPEVLTATP
ncbi:MAG: hypothetical protein QM652_07545 [Legionella sp.]|uniref:hypothetical protein n=1 Tax=Legionella sp. TaxID=459 RepID=UPI0039E56088